MSDEHGTGTALAVLIAWRGEEGAGGVLEFAVIAAGAGARSRIDAIGHA